MSDFDPSKYGSALADLIASASPMPLDAGKPTLDAKSALAELSVDYAFSHATVTDFQMARCCLSGLWLLHNFLDESHTISQGISTPSGSYWHGIMHRREGDYSNSKYWMRRVGDHPVLDAMAEREPGWDPFHFVDACEQGVRSGKQDEVAVLLAQQQLEWQLLFDFCYAAAVGK